MSENYSVSTHGRIPESTMMPLAVKELLEKQAAPRIWARQVAFERGLLGDTDQPLKLTKFQRGYLEQEIFGKQLDLGVKKGSQRFSDAQITAFATYFAHGGGDAGMQMLTQSPKKILLAMQESSKKQFMVKVGGKWVERKWVTKAKGDDIFTLKTEEVVTTRHDKTTGKPYEVVETKLADRSDEGITKHPFAHFQDYLDRMQREGAGDIPKVRSFKEGDEIGGETLSSIHVTKQLEFYKQPRTVSEIFEFPTKELQDAFAKWKTIRAITGVLSEMTNCV